MLSLSIFSDNFVVVEGQSRITRYERENEKGLTEENS